MAAAVLLLVGMVAVLSFWLGRQPAATDPQAVAEEWLPSTGTTAELHQLAEYRAIYSTTPRIEEGEVGQRLRVKED